MYGSNQLSLVINNNNNLRAHSLGPCVYKSKCTQKFILSAQKMSGGNSERKTAAEIKTIRTHVD